MNKGLDILKEKDAYPGKQVGHLTLISRKRVKTKNYGNRWQWHCKCDCGNYCDFYTFQVGITQSKKGYIDCGRHQAERVSEALKGKQKMNFDNLKDSNPRSPFRRLYEKWGDMLRRCYKPQAINYSIYGARGIRVCIEWHSYNNFKQWALRQGYDSKDKDRNHQTLDRIYVNGNYEPQNCRLISNKDQQNNKRTNILIHYQGKSQTMMQWCNDLGLNYATVNTRYRNGLRGAKLFAKPQIKYSKYHAVHVLYKGQSLSLEKLSKKVGISSTTLRKRYRAGIRMPNLIKTSNRTHSYK